MQKRNPSASDDQYFATLPPDQLISACHDRIETYYDYLQESGLYALWQRSWRAYYGARLTGTLGSTANTALFDSAQLGQGGKKGEITLFKVNHFRSLVKHTLQLSTATRPAFACRATNSDSKSQAQAVLGNGLIDYYMREKKLQRFLFNAVESALVVSEGWIHCPWNPNGGEEYVRDGQAVGMEGDIEFGNKGPLDVVRDIDEVGTDMRPTWRLVRDKVNRFEVAAEFPAIAEQLLAVNGSQVEDHECFDMSIGGKRDHDTDYVYRWTLYHENSPAVKEGRMVQFVADILLFDGPMPYRRIPLHRVTPEHIQGTAFGYSPAFDLLGPQQVLDILNSVIISNNATNGVQSIWTKTKDNLQVINLEGGMKNLQSETKPEPIQLTQTAAETFTYAESVVAQMETIAGISSTVRGNPEANLKSGSALALVVSQSIQYASQLEASVNALFEDVGTDLIIQLRDFSKTERVANILGESARPLRRQFTADDLVSINRVVVEAVSPLSKTVSGRVQMADDLWQKGLLKTNKQYITVLTTGLLDPAIEGTQQQLLNIKSENEQLQRGQVPIAIVMDIHEDHIREHLDVLATPEARTDVTLVRAVLAHVAEHLRLWRTADPAVLKITGQNPPPPPLMPMGMPGSEMAPNGAPQAPGGPAPGMSQQVAPPAPGGVAPDSLPNQPNMPNLPPNAPPEAQAAFDSAS